MMASLLTGKRDIGYWLQHDLVWINKLLETLKMSLQAMNAISINTSKRSQLFLVVARNGFIDGYDEALNGVTRHPLTESHAWYWHVVLIFFSPVSGAWWGCQPEGGQPSCGRSVWRWVLLLRSTNGLKNTE